MSRTAAYTKFDPAFPGFVNLSELEDGSFRLLVRGDPTTSADTDQLQCGSTVAIQMTRDEVEHLVALMQAIL